MASLISVPLQLNDDQDIGPGEGERWQLNIQPVVPITLGLGARYSLEDADGGPEGFGLRFVLTFLFPR